MCRGNARLITSLPVSPCSSPLRSYGPAHQSCYLSPPHTSYMGLGQSGYNLNEYAYNTRPNALFTLDPSRDSSLLKVQTPGGSPRRPLWHTFHEKRRKNILLTSPGIILSIVYQKYVWASRLSNGNSGSLVWREIESFVYQRLKEGYLMDDGGIKLSKNWGYDVFA